MQCISKPAAAAAILAMLTSTAVGAAGFDTVTKTINIPLSANSQVTTEEGYPANKVAWPCPLNTMGSGADPATPGMVRVGWDHYFDSGTAPFPCQHRINHVQRVVLGAPDLRPLKDKLPRMFVKSARLSFDKKRIAGDHDCADKLLAVVPGSAPIPPNVEELFDLPVPPLDSGGCAGGRCSVEMRGMVDQWARGQAAEMGLALIGDQERTGANDNVSCLTDYGNFVLDVTFSFDVPKGEMLVPILKIPLAPLIHLDVAFVRKTTTELIYDLRWTVTDDGKDTDIVRDGAVVQTVPDDGSQRDRAPFGPHSYKVCVTATTNCSNEVKVSN